ncbi:MAG: NAD(+) kinase [Planctomycetota bacterium]|nr:MAG: NAD(+) kinase [Planctomycetota bacterium]
MPPPRKRIFLIGNAQKPHVIETFEKFSAWLTGLGVLAGSDLDCQPDRIKKADPDLIIALGGDGTILAVGQALRDRQIPIVGVNMGKLGYLADFSAVEVEEHLDMILNDHELVSRRMMLDVRLSRPDSTFEHGIALNDCVIRVAEPFRTVGLTVYMDDRPVTTIVSDGLILSTPTGSTAHNMACGGPIVQPDVEAIILTPLCPHSLTHRPIVVGPQTHVGIAVRKTDTGASLVLDGHYVCPIPGGSHLHVNRSSESFLLVRNPRRKSWETLVQKLKWGQALT